MAAKLQCEICGGKLIGRPGGIYECDSCGMEFDTAWAKAKIQEIMGTVKVEGTVEVTGKVQIDGPVKVENGGPSADSLVKRGMMALKEQKPKLMDPSEEPVYLSAKKRDEIKSCFDRALEIDPENGGAFWGLYLMGKKWYSSEEALREAPSLEKLEDSAGYFSYANEFAKGEYRQTIQNYIAAWKNADQSEQLPPDMREDFSIHNGILRLKEGAEPQLTSVEVPSCVTELGIGAFGYCDKLTEVSLPETVTIIACEAFSGCEALTSITIPSKVTKIDDSTFANCTSLKTVVLPNGVTDIGMWAFSGCKKLYSIHIPESVKTIRRSAFKDCNRMKSLTIPESVTELEAWAFSSCTKLETLSLPGGLKEIGEFLCYGCSGLKSITIPNSVERIERSAFQNCTGLSSVLIPASVKRIGTSAFEGCTNLQSVTIPESVSWIEEDAFSNCSKLTIFGAVGSEAEKVAKREGIPFSRLKTAKELEEEEAARKATEEAAARKAAAEETARKAAEEKAEAERKAGIAALNEEKSRLQSELANLKGLFSGKRRREIEARLAQIEAELSKLG